MNEGGQLAPFAIQGIELLRWRQVVQGAKHTVLPALLDKFAGTAQGQKQQQARRAAHHLPGVEVGGGKMPGIGFVGFVEALQQRSVVALLTGAAKQIGRDPIQLLIVPLLLQAQVSVGVLAVLVTQLGKCVLLRQPPERGVE
ncbi:hypothetical protein D3C84_740600 [compost metagenome]